MKCNYRSWKQPAHQIKAWQRCFKEKVRKTKSFVHILIQRTGALLASLLCLRSEHQETNFWSSWESTRTLTRVKLTLGNVNNGFTLWNNKILPKIQPENKGHAKLNIKTLMGVSGSLGSGSVPQPQPGARQLRGHQDSPLHLSRERPRLGWDMCLQVKDQGQVL